MSRCRRTFLSWLSICVCILRVAPCAYAQSAIVTGAQLGSPAPAPSTIQTFVATATTSAVAIPTVSSLPQTTDSSYVYADVEPSDPAIEDFAKMYGDTGKWKMGDHEGTHKVIRTKEGKATGIELEFYTPNIKKRPHYKIVMGSKKKGQERVFEGNRLGDDGKPMSQGKVVGTWIMGPKGFTNRMMRLAVDLEKSEQNAKLPFGKDTYHVLLNFQGTPKKKSEKKQDDSVSDEARSAFEIAAQALESVPEDERLRVLSALAREKLFFLTTWEDQDAGAQSDYDRYDIDTYPYTDEELEPALILWGPDENVGFEGEIDSDLSVIPEALIFVETPVQ